MVNTPKKNYSPLLDAKDGQSTKRSTQWRHPVNAGKRVQAAETLRALGAWRSLWSKKKLAAEKRWKTHFLINEEKEEWIEHYVERETVGARKQVEDAEAAISQEQEDTEVAENAGLTTREPEKLFEYMMIAVGDSLYDIASSVDGEDTDDEDDEETELGQLSDDDEPGWVMGTITKTVQQRMERFRQKLMKLDELTHPGWEDAADYFCERENMYDTSESRDAAVVQPQRDDVIAAPAPTALGALIESVDIFLEYRYCCKGHLDLGVVIWA